MRAFYRELSEKYRDEEAEKTFRKIFEILDFEENKFIEPKQRYAWKVRKEFEEDYVKKGIGLAKKQQEEFLRAAGESC